MLQIAWKTAVLLLLVIITLELAYVIEDIEEIRVLTTGIRTVIGQMKI